MSHQKLLRATGSSGAPELPERYETPDPARSNALKVRLHVVGAEPTLKINLSSVALDLDLLEPMLHRWNALKASFLR